MVHLRLNESESNPNPHINFITALPSIQDIQEESRQLLRALAAQVRPVMKRHGFVVNSFEEYEYNQVFAGRNWNNGETVEIVLRLPGGDFYPTSWLMSTLCHELAHIKHMNHGPAFQALWKLLRTEVRQLQDKGYYGDGYWSSGTRLADSAQITGLGIETGDFPEYMCGGAQTRTKPTAQRRRVVARGKRREVAPSLHTGRQTAKRRKAGSRVTSKYAFAGQGATLADDGGWGDTGKGKGKRANSKRAREERALATERRIQALLGGPGAASSAPVSTGDRNEDLSEDEGDDDNDEVEIVGETDLERRETLLASKQDNDDVQYLGSGKSWKQFEREFDFNHEPRNLKTPEGSKRGKEAEDPDIIDLSSDEENYEDCDIPIASGSTYTQSQTPQSAAPKRVKGNVKGGSRNSLGNDNPKNKLINPIGIGGFVQAEVELRTKESLGMAPVKGGGRTIGGRATRQPLPTPSASYWSCQVCTLENNSEHLACSACANPRGQNVWEPTGQDAG